MNPTDMPSVDSTKSPTEQDLSSVQMDIPSTPLLVTAGATAVVVSNCVIFLMCSGCISRTFESGTASLFRTLTQLSIGGGIGLLIEFADIASDYAYASQLITDSDVKLVRMGYASLAAACVGLIFAWLKLKLIKKFIGHQIAGLIVQLKKVTPKHNVDLSIKKQSLLVAEIRK